jgi:hypothetical protein
MQPQPTRTVVSRQLGVPASHSKPPLPPNASTRRQAALSLAAGLLFTAASRPAVASGLESIPLPDMSSPVSDSVNDLAIQWKQRNQATLDAAESKFQESDLLKQLKERSDAKREQREKELRDKYCMRQAEMGVGDCAGLQLIPGATKNGVQKRPEWLDKLVYGDSPPTNE